MRCAGRHLRFASQCSPFLFCSSTMVKPLLPGKRVRKTLHHYPVVKTTIEPKEGRESTPAVPKPPSKPDPPPESVQRGADSITAHTWPREVRPSAAEHSANGLRPCPVTVRVPAPARAFGPFPRGRAVDGVACALCARDGGTTTVRIS